MPKDITYSFVSPNYGPFWGVSSNFTTGIPSGSLPTMLVLPFSLFQSIRLHVCTLRRDNLTRDLSEQWMVDVGIHVIRKQGYRGNHLTAHSEGIKLAFDGLSLPGIFFIVSCMQLKTGDCNFVS